MIATIHKPNVQELSVPSSSTSNVDSAPLTSDVESAAKRQGKSRETNTEKAIKEIKNLVTLKLKVQQYRKEAAPVKGSLGKLFSNEEITDEEADQLLRQIDVLAEYIRLKQNYVAAREKARPALSLLEESEVSEDEVLEFE